MSLTKLTTNLNNISSLPDKPSMEADELKKQFDQAGNDIKDYINNTLTEEVDKIESDINKKINQNATDFANDIKVHKYIIKTEVEIVENTDYEIPCTYKVGANNLDVYYMGERLIKDEHYKEVGQAGQSSNKIQFYNWGQSVPSERTIEFVVRGD